MQKNQQVSNGSEGMGSSPISSTSNLSSRGDADLSRPASTLKQLYAGMQPRERMISALIQERQLARGLPPLDPREVAARMRAWLPIVRDVATYALRECYHKAASVHDCSAPFDPAEIVAVWRELCATDQAQELYKREVVAKLPPGPPCEWCGGQGWMRVVQKRIEPNVGYIGPDQYSKQPVKFDYTRDTCGVVKCDCQKQSVSMAG